MRKRTWSLAALVGCAAVGVGHPAAAQASASDGGLVVYDESFFARFDPGNAEDVLRRIPGVQAILDADQAQVLQRGFGSGGAQILLNSRRFPGKANELTTKLRRIPAASIARVELISDASSGINVQSQGIVVNLVLRPGASVGGIGSFELNLRGSEEGLPGVDGLVAYAGSRGPVSYSAGIERNLWSPPSVGAARWSYRTREEAFYYPNGAVQERRPQDWRRSHDKWIFNGSLSYDFAGGDRLTLNGLYETRGSVEKATTPLIRYSAAGAEILRATEYQSRDVFDTDTLEVGGEYISSFGPGDFTGLFIVRRIESPTYDLRSIELPTGIVELSRSDSVVKTGEDIVRGSYVLPWRAGLSVELGGEGARNTLRQELLSYRDFNGDGRLEPAPAGGVPEPFVEELRGEVFAVVKWQAASRLSTDASLNYEYSELTTNYPAYPVRELGFLKPRLDARYKLTANDQLRLLIERTVSQLDFANFVPRYNVDDQVVESGNPALEPEKVWTVEVGYERRLANDGGLIEARAYYDDITDAIDRVPFCRIAGRLEPVGLCLTPGASGRLDSAFGNIPSAERYGVELKASLRLGFVGLKDAVLSLRGERIWSDVRDPFLHRGRRLRDDRTYNYDIGFRHDVTPWRMSYGFNYKSVGLATINSDLPFLEYFEVEPTLEAFVERRLNGALTLRLEVQNLTGSPEGRSRYLYDVAPAGGGVRQTVRRIDVFSEERDIRGALRLRGQF